ncbi:hypothetical protein NECAME_15067 [Necator americanus]|uniref:Phlebovirus glycoprotein G2 fusion domain-containing protein n=1 Tax=Necator americanus TaxID=51031 RepID=W2SLV5_NECAM|nr:hypothetical protein NECAME_15067 [Necator americanus]ETN69831.1 hypothetical protein NECAME_15067 [Necator americanus]
MALVVYPEQLGINACQQINILEQHSTLPSLQLTMTSLTLPPTPALNDHFISTGEETAIWKNAFTPDILCDSWAQANATNCTLHDDCECTPAENRVSCQCLSKNIDKEFNRVELKLPVKTAAVEYRRQRDTSITAKISQMVSAELVVKTKQTLTFETTIIVNEESCSVENSVLQGCYRCLKGAQAKIRCLSRTETLGEIICNNDAFVVPCAHYAPSSTPPRRSISITQGKSLTAPSTVDNFRNASC